MQEWHLPWARNDMSGDHTEERKQKSILSFLLSGWLPVLAVIITFSGTVIGMWFHNMLSPVNEKITVLEQRTNALEKQFSDQQTRVDKWMEKVDAKLDMLLERLNAK